MYRPELVDPPLFFGEWVSQRRRSLDLTQAELADVAGCSVFAVRKIESGERRPSKQLARLLVAPLQVPPEQHETFIRVARGELPLGRLSLATADEPSRRQAATPDPVRGADNVPASLAPLVGREDELAALGQYLNDPRCRLLTLIGAGGIGKTRLAMELAGRCREGYRHGICFVPLASLSSHESIIPAMADALGYAFQGQTSPRRQLIDFLCDKQMLIVMDNVEHLLNGVALFTELLAHSPKLTLLATSRERLNLQSEWVYVVQGLSVPAVDQAESAEEYPSVQLFVQVAKRARAGYTLQSADVPAIVRICQMVEGMPLGIELAAAWITVMSCAEIAREIEISLDFLATSMRDVPERQRSLEAVFNHSWNLLSGQEREILRRLAVFRGGFRRQAAEEVAGATLPDLYALVSKSLLRHHDDGRYDLHEVIRQYSLARLAGDAAYDEARDRHSDFYLSLLRDRETALKGSAQRDAIRELKDEIDNLREAWAWAVSRKRFTLVYQALRGFGWFCNVGVLYREGIEQIDPIVQALRSSVRDDEGQRVLGVALAQQGLLYFRQGRFDQAVRSFEESLGRLRPLEEPGLLSDALVVYGVILHLLGDLARAYILLEEGLACARAVEDRSYTAYALYNLGYIASLQGRYDEGFVTMHEGLAMWRELGDPSSIALGLNYLTPSAIHLGRLDTAQAYVQESLELLAQVGDRWGMGTAYRMAGTVALARGEYAEAARLLQRSLEMFQGFIIGWDVSQTLVLLGEAVAGMGELAEAECHYVDSLRLAYEVHAAPTPLAMDALAGLAQLKLRYGQAREALRLCLLVGPHPAAVHDTRQRMGRLCTEAEAALGQVEVASVREWVQASELPDVVSELLA